METEELEHVRHSLAHLLASAVLAVRPKAKLGVGPVIEDGFYYDFLLEEPLTEEDLPKLEKRMRGLVKEKLGFERQEVNPAEAKKAMKGQQFKLELIDDLVKEKQPLTLYKTGTFLDLCRGGHVENTSEIPLEGFALTRLAGAYWKGNEKNQQLQRVYGVAFGSKGELAAYRKRMEEAAKRDHKKLGPELGLFLFHHTAPGMPYWLPDGLRLYHALLQFWREEERTAGYEEISTPLLNKKELYETSGHYEHYWEDMFTIKTAEDEEYGAKAMNCPNAMVVFGSFPRSYRDLPLRLSDSDTLHRNERSGVLNGLLRVRAFRQDDAHIFIAEDQIADEYERIFALVEKFYSVFGLDYTFRLGTRPEEFLGDKRTWDQAEATLKDILEKSKKTFTIADGDGAFYGPKVDILMTDAIRREWQMGTIQLDFQQPRRFKLHYTAADGTKQTPVTIHHVIYGSFERFIGIIIEHFAGAFPLWLSPVQVALLPVSEKFIGETEKLSAEFAEEGIRAKVDRTDESVGKKIRSAVTKKVPYVLVIGEKEVQGTSFAVRVRGSKEAKDVKKEEFITKLQKTIQDRTRELSL
jgi:threonyl-tRNA synthetase